jgi:antitoxin CptB
MRELDRIRWQCRRGLLELDIVLERFQRKELEQLDVAGLNRFRELLLEPDTRLLAWVLGQEEPPEQFAALVGRLRGV